MHLSEDSEIVVGVDFSDHAHAAVDSAIRLADRFRAVVRLVHACVLPGFSFRGATWMLTPSEVSEMTARSSANLTELLHRLRAENPSIRFESTQVAGPAARSLLNVVESSKASLLVVGTHGRGFWSRLTLGAVARELVHASSVPVLTVHLEPAQSGALSLEPARVLVPMDMDPGSMQALDLSVDLAKTLGWSVHALHAYPAYEGGLFGRELEVQTFREQAMAAMMAERRHMGVPIEATCVEGGVVETILTATARSGDGPGGRIGLVVMATHPAGALRQAFVGSVASEVVRLAPCPVLTIRTPQ